MKRIFPSLALLCIASTATFGQTASAASALPADAAPASAATLDNDGPITHGLRVFTVGHSFHAWVAPYLLRLCQSAGMNDAQMGLMSLGGSTVDDCCGILHDPPIRKGEPTAPTSRRKR